MTETVCTMVTTGAGAAAGAFGGPAGAAIEFVHPSVERFVAAVEEL